MEVTLRRTFDAAHYLPGHPGKCANLHGHTYTVDITVKGTIGPNGMVIDFYILKDVVDSVLFHLDHSYLNDRLDTPTAENLTLYILDKVRGELLTRWKPLEQELFLIRGRVYESPNSWAEAAVTTKGQEIL